MDIIYVCVCITYILEINKTLGVGLHMYTNTHTYSEKLNLPTWDRQESGWLKLPLTTLPSTEPAPDQVTHSHRRAEWWRQLWGMLSGKQAHSSLWDVLAQQPELGSDTREQRPGAQEQTSLWHLISQEIFPFVHSLNFSSFRNSKGNPSHGASAYNLVVLNHFNCSSTHVVGFPV